MADLPQEPPDLSGYLRASSTRPTFGSSIPPAASGSSESPALIRLVLSLGLAKDRERAAYVLLGFAAVAVVLSFVIFYLIDAGDAAEIKAPPGYRLINTPDAPPRLDYARP